MLVLVPPEREVLRRVREGPIVEVVLVRGVAGETELHDLVDLHRRRIRDLTSGEEEEEREEGESLHGSGGYRSNAARVRP